MSLYLYKFLALPKEIEEFIGKKDTVQDVLNKRAARPEKDHIFEKLKYVNDLLGDKKLFFSKFEEFNDPLEGWFLLHKKAFAKVNKILRAENKISYSECLKRNLKAQKFLEMQNQKEYFVSSMPPMKNAKYGVYCFCDNMANILMWSHYANNHHGLCVKFKVNLSSEMVKRILSIENGFVKQNELSSVGFFLKKVSYDGLIKVDEEHIGREKKKYSDEDCIAITDYERKMLDAANSKANNWKHEQEYRLLIVQDKEQSDQLQLSAIHNGQLDSKPLFEIENVILGFKMLPEIQNFLRRNYHQDLDFKLATIDPHKLEVIEKKIKRRR